jgi:hypothetical protein
VIPRNFKSNDFVSIYSKGLRRPFFVSVHSKGVTAVAERRSTSAPPNVHEALIPEGFKSNEFVKVDSKAGVRRWRVSVRSKGFMAIRMDRAPGQSEPDGKKLLAGFAYYFTAAVKCSERLVVTQFGGKGRKMEGYGGLDLCRMAKRKPKRGGGLFWHDHSGFRSFNHSFHSRTGMDWKKLDVGMFPREHSENLVRKSLSDSRDIFEIKNDRLEYFYSR